MNNNRRLNPRAILAVALLAIGCYLLYGLFQPSLPGAKNETGNTYNVGDKEITFYDVNNGGKLVDITVSVTRVNGDNVWLSDGEGDALMCNVNTIDTTNINALVCGADVRTDMVMRAKAGLTATMTASEEKQLKTETNFCNDNGGIACTIGEGMKNIVFGLISGVMR